MKKDERITQLVVVSIQYYPVLITDNYEEKVETPFLDNKTVDVTLYPTEDFIENTRNEDGFGSTGKF